MAVATDRLARRKEYLAVAQTEAELRQYEMRLRVSGFRKRRNGSGQSNVTGEFYQWWDRKGHSAASDRSKRQIDKQRRLRAEGRCILCGEAAAESTRGGGLSQYCERHREWQRQYMKDYMRKGRNV